MLLIYSNCYRQYYLKKPLGWGIFDYFLELFMLILVLEFSKLESGVVYSVMKFYGIHQVSVEKEKVEWRRGKEPEYH